MAKRMSKRSASLASAFLVCLTGLAHAASTTLTLADAIKGSSSMPVTMQFTVTRSGNLAYDAVLNYYTVDGSAHAGTDYSAASGTVIIPAGATNATIPVTLSADTSADASVTFELQASGATGVGPAPDFAAQQTFATGAFPASVATADLNGDGLPDLVVANYSDDTVSVFFNTTPPGAATPTFAAQQTFATGHSPRSVAVADINGDGKLDVIVANEGSLDNTVSILINTTLPGAATPSFTAQQTVVVSTSFFVGPFSITTTDVNGDGRPDIVVASISETSVDVLLNTTAPGAATVNFATAQHFATGYPYSVVAADLNDDGKPDLIVADNTDNTVSVLLNTTAAGAATASFAAQQTFSTGQNPTSVAVADMNGDGMLDMIVADHADNKVSVLLNVTTPGSAIPSFAARQAFSTGFGPDSVIAKDVNGDGKLDLIVANNNSSSTISVLLNVTAQGAAKASFAAQQSFASGTDSISVVTSDVNSDGKPDLVVANLLDNTVSVLLNNTAAPTAGAPSFSSQQAFAAGSAPESVNPADINGDGKLDLVTTNINDNTVSVLLNTTAPGDMPAFSAQQTFATGALPTSVATGDLNGDGQADLVVTNYSDDTVSVLFNTTPPGAATPTFAAQQTFATGHHPRSVTAVDVNSDGKLDVIVANEGSFDNTVSVLLNTTAPGAATPSFATQQTLIVSSAFFAGPFSVTTTDINGDGRPDIIVASISEKAVNVLLNTTAPGVATVSFAPAQSFAAGYNPHSVVAADLDGDGRSDLIVANDTDNTVSVLLNTTTPGGAAPSFAAQQTFTTGQNPTAVALADVNGDGKLDLIVTSHVDSNVSIRLNTTAPGAAIPTFAAQQTFSTGLGPDSVIAKDVNGDGKPDLIVANNGSNNLSILENTQYQVSVGGSPATGTIVHDYIFANGFE